MAPTFNEKPGDLIEIFLWGYQHWAVYIGENEVVTFVKDVSPSSGSFEGLSSRGEVKLEKLTDVVGNDRCQVNNLLDEEYKARKPSIIVEVARRMEGDEPEYDLVTYNSKHFAIEMRYGKAESRQFKEKPGDLIEISPWIDQHWAVYIGENEVVHLVIKGGKSFGSFANVSSSIGNVKREKLTDVVGDDSYQVNNLLDDKYNARDPCIIVKEACAMVGRELQYNVVTYNCEHFANEMRYGVAESRQFNGKPGDLIQIFCLGYQHWAVYIGENEVVHLDTEGGQSSGSLANSSSSIGNVKRENLTDMVGKRHQHINNLLDDKYNARDPSIIVKEACAMVGRELQYNVVTYNCEHFATEMRYGKAESRQCNGNPGDLIEIFCWGYKHWAVYIGENEVVHLDTDGGQSSGPLANSSSSIGNVKREKLTDMVGKHHQHINNLLDDKYNARDPSIVVKEACAMVGRELQYNVVTYNCEHFATEMRYGKAESRQFNGKPGDLIEINCGPYKHWAIYIGENEVVHLVNEGGRSSGWLENPGNSNGKVKREKFADVVGHHRCQVNNLLDNKRKARDPSVIVKEACAMVGRKLPYNVATYNSEHFATDLRYGKAESGQFKGKPGDLIEIFLWGYRHWAIYIRENEVVHFTTDDVQSSGSFERLSSTGKVKREKLANLLGLKGYRVNNLQDEEFNARDPSIIVKEACEMVGCELQYNVDTYNCEHFATEMRYGKFKGNKGDLIEISHRDHKQWAIYIGGNEVVMLVKKGDQSPGWLESLSSSTGKVKREKLAAVVGNHRCRVNNLLDDRRNARDPSVIVKKACAMVGRNLPYNVATYNSWHFATEMRYDKAESWLVKKTSLIASIAGVLVALVTGGSVVAVGFAVVGAFAACKALIRRCSSS